MIKHNASFIPILLFILSFIGLGFLLGWSVNEIYEGWKYEREFNGLYLENINNWSEARNKAYSLEDNGDWVCVNIRDMDYKTALDTCNHETGHYIFSEIFAEQCENNMTKCLEMLNSQ